MEYEYNKSPLENSFTCVRRLPKDIYCLIANFPLNLCLISKMLDIFLI